MRRRGVSFGNVSGTTGIAIVLGLIIVAAIIIYMSSGSTPESPPAPRDSPAPRAAPATRAESARRSAPITPSGGAPIPEPMPSPSYDDTPEPSYQPPQVTPRSSPTPREKNYTWMCLEFYSGQMYSSPELTNNRTSWSHLPNGTIGFHSAIQLQDLTYVAIEAGPHNTNQLWIANYASNLYSGWTHLLPSSGYKAMPAKQILQLRDGTFAVLEYYTNQIWTSPVLTADKEKWKWENRDMGIGFHNITQLNDGTFACIEWVTNQIWTSPKLTNDRKSWKPLPPVPAGKTPMPAKQILQLRDGTFAVLEYRTNQIWTSPVLTAIKEDWNWENRDMGIGFREIFEVEN